MPFDRPQFLSLLLTNSICRYNQTTGIQTATLYAQAKYGTRFMIPQRLVFQNNSVLIAMFNDVD
jgi:folate-binding Fe-S cluster repair protein YgfZ